MALMKTVIILPRFWDAEGNLLPSLDALVSMGSPLTTGHPLALTLAASNTTATTTALNGQAYANGAPSTAYFEWGLTTSYGNFTTTNLLATNYLSQKPGGDAFQPVAFHDLSLPGGRGECRRNQLRG